MRMLPHSLMASIAWLVFLAQTSLIFCREPARLKVATFKNGVARDFALRIPIGGSLEESSNSSADKAIVEFLEAHGEPKGKFFIQGWRWHTLSLVRDAGRLEQLALRMQVEVVSNLEALEKAANHVVDFNMKGLHRVENELFFPWLREKLTTDVDKVVSKAFSAVLDELDIERQKIARIGVAVRDQAKLASTPGLSDERRSEAVANVAQLSAALTARTRGLQLREEKILVPAVAALVSDSEQKSFNNKVIRKLGFFDSRVHLVGMHDAVWELGDSSERELFKETIPKIPRLMIPRWRKQLYDPQASVLAEKP